MTKPHQRRNDTLTERFSVPMSTSNMHKFENLCDRLRVKKTAFARDVLLAAIASGQKPPEG